jgi:hypothetical protein
MVIPNNDAPYICILPWHIGRKLEGYDIPEHSSFVCEWDVLCVDWSVVY